MNWTNEKPSRLGWYWWRGEKDWYAGMDHHPLPIILAVTKREWADEELLEVQHPFMDYQDKLEDWEGEWFGPLEPPP